MSVPMQSSSQHNEFLDVYYEHLFLLRPEQRPYPFNSSDETPLRRRLQIERVRKAFRMRWDLEMGGGEEQAWEKRWRRWQQWEKEFAGEEDDADHDEGPEGKAGEREKKPQRVEDDETHVTIREVEVEEQEEEEEATAFPAPTLAAAARQLAAVPALTLHEQAIFHDELLLPLDHTPSPTYNPPYVFRCRRQLGAFKADQDECPICRLPIEPQTQTVVHKLCKNAFCRECFETHVETATRAGIDICCPFDRALIGLTEEDMEGDGEYEDESDESDIDTSDEDISGYEEYGEYQSWRDAQAEQGGDILDQQGKRGPIYLLEGWASDDDGKSSRHGKRGGFTSRENAPRPPTSNRDWEERQERTQADIDADAVHQSRRQHSVEPQEPAPARNLGQPPSLASQPWLRPPRWYSNLSFLVHTILSLIFLSIVTMARASYAVVKRLWRYIDVGRRGRRYRR